MIHIDQNKECLKPVRHHLTGFFEERKGSKHMDETVKRRTEISDAIRYAGYDDEELEIFESQCFL